MIGWAPTATTTFMRCPQLWTLSKTYEPRQQWTPNMLVGTAIHHMMADRLVSGKDARHIEICGRHILEKGWPEGITDYTIDGTWAQMMKVMAKLPDDLLEGEEVVAAEVCLSHDEPGHVPIPGDCPITDLITKRADGGYVITDWKTKGNLEARWIPKELARVETSWQLRDYAWRASHDKRFGPVTRVRHVLIILGPAAKIVQHTVPLYPGDLDAWRRSAEHWWRGMDDGVTAMNPEGCEKYGGCWAMDVCWRGGDPDKLYGRRIPRTLSAI